MVYDAEEKEETPGKPQLRMVGTDGNVFAIIGRVGQCLKQHGRQQQANEWCDRATHCSSYDEVLALMYEFIDPY